MFNFLFDPLTAPFMQTALLEMALLSLLVAVVGTYVVLRHLAFLILALSHGVFPGIVLAFIIGWNYLMLSVITGIVISLLIGLVGRSERVGSDSAIAGVYTGMFALGIVLVSSLRTFKGLSEILFGRTFGIGWLEILTTAAVGAVVLTLMLIFRKEILLTSFDRNMARAQGLPVGLLETGFLVIVAVTVIVALPAVGNIQLVALLVTAPATARLVTRRLGPMMVVAGLFSLLGSTIGLYLAYYYNFAPGSSVVASLTGLFLLTLLFSPWQGLLARWWRGREIPLFHRDRAKI